MSEAIEPIAPVRRGIIRVSVALTVAFTVRFPWLSPRVVGPLRPKYRPDKVPQMSSYLNNLLRTTRALVLFGATSSLALTSLTAALGDNIYTNNFNNGSTDENRLELYRGMDRLTVGSYSIGGRSGGMAKVTHTASSGWESVLGDPDIPNVTQATVRYRVFFPGSWQFRLQGKLPGLQPEQAHFGGNADDPVEWNKWSVRLMWISTTATVQGGDDTKARPSIYVYDQNRQLGNTGTHYRVDYNFPENKWLAISMYVKLNTHNGSIANSNGEVRLYIDGVLVETVTGLKLVGNIPSGRSASEARISRVAFHNYYGGSKTGLNVPTVSSTTCYFDDLSVFEGFNKLEP